MHWLPIWDNWKYSWRLEWVKCHFISLKPNLTKHFSLVFYPLKNKVSLECFLALYPGTEIRRFIHSSPAVDLLVTNLSQFYASTEFTLKFVLSRLKNSFLKRWKRCKVLSSRLFLVNHLQTAFGASLRDTAQRSWSSSSPLGQSR